MSSSESQSQPHHLSNINSATLGAQMPVITLGDGKKVPTGTIGALLINIKAYDEIIASRGGDSQADEKIKELEEKFKAALPVLRWSGMLELFEPREWIEGARSAGRKRVGELALEEGV